MANEEHLEILNHGIDSWNRGRLANLEVEPDLSWANLTNYDLTRANLTTANLSKSRLWIANLLEADLSSADLSDADLAGALLIGANLSYANLNNTNFQGADLVDANLAYANLRDTSFLMATIGGTLFVSVDLRQADGLETVTHIRPSNIDIDAIYLSKGNVLEEFLLGSGVPSNFLERIASLTSQEMEFYRCFISFTESDDTFAEKIYSDLKNVGVQCWRWKEDAKWGRTLMRSIDEAVRTHDKLIVICSEQSLNSPAVIREIERALQKEDEWTRQGENIDVLFPIRIDDYIFTGWHHHRKADVIEKCVGNFRQWQRPESYSKALDRLIRDLKADERDAGDA